MLSPDTVSVRRGKAVFRYGNGGYGLANGFAAPECYSGEKLIKAADVYAVCALLSYAACGKVPPLSTERTENTVPIKSLFVTMIQEGMRLNASDRTPELSSVTACLRKYVEHTKKSTHGKNEETALAIKKTRNKNKKRCVWIAAAGVLVIVISAYFGTYFAAVGLAENENFKTAQKLVFAPFVTNLHDPEFTAYLSAGCAMENHDYETAQTEFEALGDYRASAELADGMIEREIRYLAEKEHRYDDALELCEQIGDKELSGSISYDAAMYYLRSEIDYEQATHYLVLAKRANVEVSDELVAEANYGMALDLIDGGNYVLAFLKLKNYAPSYEDSSDFQKILAKRIYNDAVEAYRADEYDEAERLFKILDGYADSEDYLFLLMVRYIWDWRWYDESEDWAMRKLSELFYFENTTTIIQKNNLLLQAFLEGSWYTSDGDYYFTMTRDGQTSYNLPWFEFGDYYRLNEGVYELYRKSDGAARSMFEFTLLSPDSINVYCYQDGHTYTLYRG